MKKTLLLVMTASVLFGCNNATVKVGDAMGLDSVVAISVKEKLDKRLEGMVVPSQIFDVPADRHSVVTGAGGTVLFIAPEDIEMAAGVRTAGHITVELKELINQYDMLRSGAQTRSDNRLLVSGGSYYIGMTAGGVPVKLKEGRSLKVAFPKRADKSMSLFYGERDKDGLMNWLPAKQTLAFGSKKVKEDIAVDRSSITLIDDRAHHVMGYVTNDSTYIPDTAKIIAEDRRQRREANPYQFYVDSVNELRAAAAQQVDNMLYNVAQINKLGWVNADRLFNEAARSTLTYAMAPADSIVYARVYMLFSDVNAMLQSSYGIVNGESSGKFPCVPVGYKVKLIAVTYRNNRLFTCNLDIKTESDQHTLITWKATGEAELNGMFRGDNAGVAVR